MMGACAESMVRDGVDEANYRFGLPGFVDAPTPTLPFRGREHSERCPERVTRTASRRECA